MNAELYETCVVLERQGIKREAKAAVTALVSEEDLVRPIWNTRDRSPIVRTAMRHVLVRKAWDLSHDLDISMRARRRLVEFDWNRMMADLRLARDLDEGRQHAGLFDHCTERIERVRDLPD